MWLAIIIYIGLLLIPKRYFAWLELEKRSWTKILIAIPVLYLVLALLQNPSFYFPYGNGLLGDNYMHMAWAIENESLYVKHHHLLFPLVPDVVITGFVKLGILNPDSPSFEETAYLISIYLVLIPCIVMIGYFAFAHYKYHKSILDLIIILILPFTSYALWGLAIQSNARGLAIAYEFFAFGVLIWAFRTRTTVSFFLLGFAVSGAMFLYNGLIYFCVGIFIAITLLIFLYESQGIRTSLKHFSAFVFIVLLMAYLFYEVQAKVNHTRDLDRLFDRLSDTRYFGEFSLDEVDWKENWRKNKEASFINFTNHTWEKNYNIWDKRLFQLPASEMDKRSRKFGNFLLQLLLVIGVFDLIFMRKAINFPLFLAGLIVSLTTLAGFMLRQAGSPYFVVAFAPNLALLFSFTLSREKGLEYRRLIFILLLICLFYINGFGFRSILDKKNIEDHLFYTENQLIASVNEKDSAVYFRNIDQRYYPNLAINAFYRRRFGSINWINDSSILNNQRSLQRSISDSHAKSIAVFIGPEIVLQDEGLEIIQISDSVRQVLGRSD